MNTQSILPFLGKFRARAGQRQLQRDLDFVFQDPRWFSTGELRHLRENMHRLVRGVYLDAANRRCIFGLLTELRATPIASREALTRFFTGGAGHPYCDMEVYQPAKWLVRIWDEAWDGELLARYKDRSVVLDRKTLRAALDRAIAARRDAAPPRRAATTIAMSTTLTAAGV